MPEIDCLQQIRREACRLSWLDAAIRWEHRCADACDQLCQTWHEPRESVCQWLGTVCFRCLGFKLFPCILCFWGCCDLMWSAVQRNPKKIGYVLRRPTTSIWGNIGSNEMCRALAREVENMTLGFAVDKTVWQVFDWWLTGLSTLLRVVLRCSWCFQVERGVVFCVFSSQPNVAWVWTGSGWLRPIRTCDAGQKIFFFFESLKRSPGNCINPNIDLFFLAFPLTHIYIYIFFIVIIFWINPIIWIHSAWVVFHQKRCSRDWKNEERRPRFVPCGLCGKWMKSKISSMETCLDEHRGAFFENNAYYYSTN